MYVFTTKFRVLTPQSCSLAYLLIVVVATPSSLHYISRQGGTKRSFAHRRFGNQLYLLRLRENFMSCRPGFVQHLMRQVGIRSRANLPAWQVTMPAPLATSPEIFLTRWLLVSATYSTSPVTRTYVVSYSKRRGPVKDVVVIHRSFVHYCEVHPRSSPTWRKTGEGKGNTLGLSGALEGRNVTRHPLVITAC